MEPDATGNPHRYCGANGLDGRATLAAFVGPLSRLFFNVADLFMLSSWGDFL